MNEQTRAYIYRVLVALSAVAIGYGLLSSDEVALWLAVAAAVLGNGLATAHTSTAPQKVAKKRAPAKNAAKKATPK